ncbi:MAG: FAD-binding protein, partial [Leptospira sp.]|nr:FAD-binding protein [Leptospira sp.]
MKYCFDVRTLPEIASDLSRLKNLISSLHKIPESTIDHIQITNRSIDARQKIVHFQLKVDVYVNETYIPKSYDPPILKNVKNEEPILIVGAGPAGLFAALRTLELGKKPIIIERGKNVKDRIEDLRAINVHQTVNEDSNYCFGEGGAGTYSDGKLYTRSKKRGNVDKVLELLVGFGATNQILVDAHPHIGSNKLPGVVANIRETILHYGGEIHFDSCVTDFLMEGPKVVGVLVNDLVEYRADATILATGHSARDIYQLLLRKQIAIEAKPFALGVRIEHPQPLIDKIQYHQEQRAVNLPASSYKLACQVDGRGVFSFCMCPGGLVVPAATAPGELVVNGMSMSRRDSPYANSGTVWGYGDGSQKAPAVRLTDFVKGKVSQSLPGTSYIPGIYPAPLHELLPGFIAGKLQAAVKQFGKQMRGYFTEEAVVIGTESRTSAPVRIPRDPVTCMHPQARGLFPG